VSTECNVTLQAVYKELRRLRGEDIVIDKNKQLSLTLWYINEQLSVWGNTSNLYNQKYDISQVFNIQRGKRFSFSFNNLAELDSFWTQSYLFLERIIPETIPMYACIPHDWFFYSRPASDERWTNAQSRIQRLIITHPTELDFAVLKQRRKQGYQFTPKVNPLKQSETTYYTLIGDWIFEAELDKKVENILNDLVSNTDSVSDIRQDKLNVLLSTKGKFTLKVHHAPKKAGVFTKRLARYFD
jgi:hypothetical protein